jgi:DNA polymerase III delta prime subunit
MDIPYLFKFRPKNITDFQLNTDIECIVEYFINSNSLLLLLIGESGTGKTSLIECIINTYFKDISTDKKYENILNINSLSDQGIVYFRQEVYTFCQSNSTIRGRNKMIIIDDIDKLNEQTQQIFHSCIDKFSNKVNFILSCTNTQKTNQHILNKVFKLKLEPFTFPRLTTIMEHITIKEQLIIDNDVKIYIIHLCNYSIRMLINYLEKFKLMNKPIDMTTCKALITNISFSTFKTFTKLCVYDKNIKDSIKLLYELYNHGYSVSDILDNYFIYIKYDVDIEEEIKFKIISLICKYIIIANELHEDEIELVFFANRLTMI